MAITFNANTVNVVIYNNTDCDKVIFNGNTVFEKQPSYPPYLTFSSPSSFTLDGLALNTWDGIIEYSTNAISWSEWDGFTRLSSGADGALQKLYIRGSGNTIISGAAASGWYLTGADISCDGDIRTLLEYSDIENVNPAARCFMQLFAQNNNLIKAPDLLLETVPQQCYNGMFKESGLKQSPIISAKTANGGANFADMFNGCAELISLPALLTLSLPGACYQGMFKGCTKIKISETQTDEYQTPYRIPINGTGAVIGSSAMNYMFDNTGGTFTRTPTINTTYYTSNTVV